MSAHSIPYLIVSIYTLGLGIITLFYNPRSKKNRLFFLITLFSFIWLFSYGASFNISSYKNVVRLLKIGHLGAILLSPGIYYFALELLGNRKKAVDVICARLSIAACLACSILIFSSPLYFKGVTRQFWGYYPEGGPLMVAYSLITFSLASRIVYLLFRASRNAKKDFQFSDYQKFKYHSISVIIFVFAAIDYLPKYGVKIYPFGYVFVGLFSSISTYAIVRHKLFDIDIVIRRSFFYSFLIAILTSIYLLVILVSEFVFRSFFGYRSLLLAFIAASTIAVTFNPLRTKLQSIIDRYFFKIDPEKIIKENILMKDALQKQDHLKAVALFASGMAHEVKNPLATIKTFAEYLPKKYDDPDFRDKFQKTVVDEVDRINGIVRQLLDFSKPQPPQLSPTSVHTVISETLSPLSNIFLKGRINVVLGTLHGKTEILADKNQLKQVFLNLFLNAVQAMPEGGTLTIDSQSVDQSLAIVIEDTGCGIPADQLPYIFEPFYTTKQSGTGLGLSIVKEIVDAHDGKLRAESEARVGTKFYLTFKICE